MIRLMASTNNGMASAASIVRLPFNCFTFLPHLTSSYSSLLLQTAHILIKYNRIFYLVFVCLFDSTFYWDLNFIFRKDNVFHQKKVKQNILAWFRRLFLIHQQLLLSLLLYMSTLQQPLLSAKALR